MKGFQKCERGHFYKDGLAVCPYCPKPSGGNPEGETKIAGGGAGSGSNLDKTQISGGGGGDNPSSGPVVSHNRPPRRDLNKTFIQETEPTKEGTDGPEVVRQRATRKIVGWLISYSLDPMGIDYRLYEGSNTMGRNAENSISIPGDVSVSGRHATILFKKGKFFVRDEMAANGTYINDEELEIGQPSQLADGDELKLGKTVFKFKTPL
jgi:hypothetical protein